jgi:hypothetical protein
MTHPVRPVFTFVLRLWREPGDPEGEAGWRGLIRPLGASAATSSEKELPFHGLEKLLAALRALLDAEDLAEEKTDAPPRPPDGDVAG